MGPPADGGKVLALAPAAGTGNGAAIASFLRQLAADAEAGRVLGVAVAVELRGAEVGTMFCHHDAHRLLGALARIQHRLLTEL